MGRVDRRLAYLFAWSVAATITVSVSWLGIRSVLAAAAPTRTVPLSAAELRRVAPIAPPAPSAAASPSAAAAPPSEPVAPGPSSSAAPASPTASPTGGWQRDGEGFKRIFHTVGGDADFFMTKDAVQISSSTPKPGYTVNVTRYGVDSVMVSFFGNRKTSRVWVRWWNGPYGETTESVD
jgi:hypothetical protein